MAREALDHKLRRREFRKSRCRHPRAGDKGHHATGDRATQPARPLCVVGSLAGGGWDVTKYRQVPSWPSFLARVWFAGTDEVGCGTPSQMSLSAAGGWGTAAALSRAIAEQWNLEGPLLMLGRARTYTPNESGVKVGFRCCGEMFRDSKKKTKTEKSRQPSFKA
jgi:hypothetical protein